MKYIFYFSLLISYKIHGQFSTSYKESLYTHISGTEFVVGEKLYYTVYVRSNESEYLPLSNVAYLELVGEKSGSIIKHIVPIENGIGNGSFFLSSNLETGRYKVLGYTKWQLNYEDPHVFEQDIIIINPYLPFQNDLIGQLEADVPKSKMIGRFERGSKIELQVDSLLNTMPLKYSISVRLKDDIDVKKTSSAFDFERMDNLSIKYIPDFGGINVEFISSAEVDKNLFLINSDKEYFNVARLDSGWNVIRVPYYDLLSFQWGPSSGASMVDFSPKVTFSTGEPLILEKEKRESIGQKAKFVQLTSLFEQYLNEDFVRKEETISNSGGLVRFDKAYSVSDFESFDHMNDFVNEVIEGARINDKKELIISDKIYSDIPLKPLVMLNSLPVFDTDFLFSNSTDYFSSAEILREIFYYNNATFGGVINFTTSKSEVVSIPEGFNSFNFSTEINSSSYPNQLPDDFPDYRIQLFWGVKTDTNLQFKTSKVPGQYEIRIVGVDKNWDLLERTFEFTVK